MWCRETGASPSTVDSVRNVIAFSALPLEVFVELGVVASTHISIQRLRHEDVQFKGSLVYLAKPSLRKKQNKTKHINKCDLVPRCLPTWSRVAHGYSSFSEQHFGDS